MCLTAAHFSIYSWGQHRVGTDVTSAQGLVSCSLARKARWMSPSWRERCKMVLLVADPVLHNME